MGNVKLNLKKTPQMQDLQRLSGAEGGDWTHDLFITSELLYHWATSASYIILAAQFCLVKTKKNNPACYRRGYSHEIGAGNLDLRGDV